MMVAIFSRIGHDPERFFLPDQAHHQSPPRVIPEDIRTKKMIKSYIIDETRRSQRYPGRIRSQLPSKSNIVRSYAVGVHVVRICPSLNRSRHRNLSPTFPNGSNPSCTSEQLSVSCVTPDTVIYSINEFLDECSEGFRKPLVSLKSRLARIDTEISRGGTACIAEFA